MTKRDFDDDWEEVNAYITAIEQERDEALEFIRGLYLSGREPNYKFSLEGLWMTGVQEQARCFLSRIEGGDDERE